MDLVSPAANKLNLLQLNAIHAAKGVLHKLIGVCATTFPNGEAFKVSGLTACPRSRLCKYIVHIRTDIGGKGHRSKVRGLVSNIDVEGGSWTLPHPPTSST